MPQDTEEWYIVRGKTDLLFKKWQEFREFWPEHSHVSEICTLIGSLCKVYNNWPKEVQRSYLSWHSRVMQIWRKTDWWFAKWNEKFDNFHQNSPVRFWLKHNVLLTKLAHQSVKFSDLLLLALKFTQFIFGSKGQFFLKISIILRVMRHNSSVLSSKTLYSLWKRSPTKWNFSYFHLLALKSTKFLILTFKLRVCFPLYFALPYSIMTHNSS